MLTSLQSKMICRTALLGVCSTLMLGAGSQPVAAEVIILHSFGGKDGANPESGLIADPAGNLYGTTAGGGVVGCQSIGCGVVFKVTAKGRETVLHRFQGGNDGWLPGPLLRDKAGNLYGATIFGGGSGCDGEGCGTVFKLAPDGTETLLYSFQGGSDGESPGGLISDESGNLYGEAEHGGNYSGTDCAEYGCGTIFELSPDGTETTLYAFQGGSDGLLPLGGVIVDALGNLYGTTAEGGGSGCGSYGCGTVFQLTPDGVETVLHSFDGDNDGTNPLDGVIAGNNGNLFGTTWLGGSSGMGAVFELAPSGKESVLHSFKSGNDGAYPESGLTIDSNANIFGMTFAGGGNGCSNKHEFRGCGTVFELSAKGVETIINRFSRSQGTNPVGSLLLGAGGSLFGTTSYGGVKNHKGIVFELTTK